MLRRIRNTELVLSGSRIVGLGALAAMVIGGVVLATHFASAGGSEPDRPLANALAEAHERAVAQVISDVVDDYTPFYDAVHAAWDETKTQLAAIYPAARVDEFQTQFDETLAAWNEACGGYWLSVANGAPLRTREQRLADHHDQEGAFEDFQAKMLALLAESGADNAVVASLDGKWDNALGALFERHDAGDLQLGRDLALLDEFHERALAELSS